VFLSELRGFGGWIDFWKGCVVRLDNGVAVLTIVDYATAEALFRNGKIEAYDTFHDVPDTFKDAIRTFMQNNVGYETGPIFCIVKLNGETVSLLGTVRDSGEFKLTDLLPVSAGDVVVEFLVRNDSIATIGVNRFMEVKTMAREFGEENDIVLEELASSLMVGVSEDEDNVFCFMSSLDKKNCVRYALIDESWRAKYGSLFKGVEEGKVGSLNVF
jgi:hypothetical protein